MTVAELLKLWELHASSTLTPQEYPVRLFLHDAARIRALAELYPQRTEAQIIAELLSAALDELEAGFPYVQGSRAVAEDEFGDPVYEDTGLTPRFLALTRKHLEILQGQAPGDEREAP